MMTQNNIVNKLGIVLAKRTPLSEAKKVGAIRLSFRAVIASLMDESRAVLLT